MLPRLPTSEFRDPPLSTLVSMFRPLFGSLELNFRSLIKADQLWNNFSGEEQNFQKRLFRGPRENFCEKFDLPEQNFLERNSSDRASSAFVATTFACIIKTIDYFLVEVMT